MVIKANLQARGGRGSYYIPRCIYYNNILHCRTTFTPFVSQIMAKTTATEVFRSYEGELMTAIPEPDFVAMDLFSQGIMSVETRDKVHLPGQTNGQKNIIILKAVEGAITQEVLEKLLTVLDKYPPADIIANKMRGEHYIYNCIQ